MFEDDRNIYEKFFEYNNLLLRNYEEKNIKMSDISELLDSNIKNLNEKIFENKKNNKKTKLIEIQKSEKENLATRKREIKIEKEKNENIEKVNSENFLKFHFSKNNNLYFENFVVRKQSYEYLMDGKELSSDILEVFFKILEEDFFREKKYYFFLPSYISHGIQNNNKNLFYEVIAEKTLKKK